jgi:CRP-like cAMP-binding protein
MMVQARPEPAQPGTRQNGLLAALSPAERARLAPGLELVSLPVGHQLHEPGQQIRHAYFPITCIASLHFVTASGSTVETAGVGHEGMVGTAIFLGGGSTTISAVLQAAGHAYRMERDSLLAEFNRGGQLQRVLLRYTMSLMTQVAQTAACIRHHSVEQRLCRCLLATLDRVPSGNLVLTQDLIAGMLGVRREGITEAAGRLQQAGVIRYRRGHITVQQRTGLEAGACECHAAVTKELGRLASFEERNERSLARAG